MNKFPADFQSPLTGFGGDPSKNQATHRLEISKTPLVLVHGNGANATHPKWGWQTMVGFLRALGYKDVELWAMDYLGEDNDQGIIPGAHRDHISGFRQFVDAVKAYLGVNKVDFIAHSLGCGMVNAYIKGLQSDGTWQVQDDRIDVVGTFVALAGGTYGLGKFSQDEFRTGSNFEAQSHKFEGVDDDTPWGSTKVNQQISPVQSWKRTTPKDKDVAACVAVIAVNDFVDMQNKDTSRRQGADLNVRFDLGYGLDGHDKIIKSQTVFDSFEPYLDRYPPKPRVRIFVDKVSGTYDAPLNVMVTVNPTNRHVDYMARRLRKEFQAGYIVDTVDETLSGTISNNQFLTLSNSGAWKIELSATGADNVALWYGVGVELPVVTIETPNSPPFKGSLDVMAKTTRGRLYHSQDGQAWIEGAIFHLTRTGTVRFVALVDQGVASLVAERAYTRKADWEDRVTATLSEHFIAKRLDLQHFLDLGNKLGFTAVVTLYLINGSWVYNPDLEEKVDEPPVVSVSPDTRLYKEPVRVTLSAQDKVDPSPRVYYTVDGTTPTENSSSFVSSGSIELNTSGITTIRAMAKDSSGNVSDEVQKVYDLQIASPQPRIHCDKPNGKYGEAFQATLSVADDESPPLTVYYTQDGSDPSDPGNRKRQSFIRNMVLPVSGNGNHAILLYASDASGRETRKSFAFAIDDHRYPETAIAPSRGGRYSRRVDVTLSPSESCKWTKYTTDGSEPTDENGHIYEAPVSISRTTRLTWRSKDKNGNLEPVRTALFTVTPLPEQAVFESDRRIDGYVKAKPDGTGASVGVFSDLGIGSGWDGKDNRAILHFDTASVPDNAIVTRAYLEVTRASQSGDFWAAGRVIEVDVNKGFFGTSQAIQADDWKATADAPGAAQVTKFTSETARSSDFSAAGLKGINLTGVTQIRLRASQPHTAPNNYLFFHDGPDAKLFLGYQVNEAPSH